MASAVSLEAFSPRGGWGPSEHAPEHLLRLLREKDEIAQTLRRSLEAEKQRRRAEAAEASTEKVALQERSQQVEAELHRRLQAQEAEHDQLREELRDRCARLVEQLAEAQSHEAEVVARDEALARDMRSLLARADSDAAELMTLRARDDALQAQVGELSRELRVSDEVRDGLMQEARGLQEQLATVRADLRDAQQTERLSREHAAVQHERLNAKCESLNKQLLDRGREVEALEERCRRLEENLRATTAEADERRKAAEAEIGKCREEATTLRDQLRAQAAVEAKLKESIAVLETQLQEHKGEESKLRQECFRLQSLADERELHLTTSKKREQHLGEQVAAVEGRLGGTLTESASRQEALYAARAQIQTLELELQGVREQLSASRAQAERRQEEQAQAHMEAQKRKDERIAQKEGELSAAQADITRVKEELRQCRGELESRENDLRRITEDLRRTAEELERTREDARRLGEEARRLAQELQQAREAEASQRAAYAALQERHRALQVDLEAVAAARRALEADLDATAAAKRALEVVREQLAADLREASASLAAAKAELAERQLEVAGLVRAKAEAEAQTVLAVSRLMVERETMTTPRGGAPAPVPAEEVARRVEEAHAQGRAEAEAEFQEQRAHTEGLAREHAEREARRKAESEFQELRANLEHEVQDMKQEAMDAKQEAEELKAVYYRAIDGERSDFNEMRSTKEGLSGKVGVPMTQREVTLKELVLEFRHRLAAFFIDLVSGERTEAPVCILQVRLDDARRHFGRILHAMLFLYQKIRTQLPGELQEAINDPANRHLMLPFYMLPYRQHVIRRGTTAMVGGAASEGSSSTLSPAPSSVPLTPPAGRAPGDVHRWMELHLSELEEALPFHDGLSLTEVPSFLSRLLLVRMQVPRDVAGSSRCSPPQVQRTAFNEVLDRFDVLLADALTMYMREWRVVGEQARFRHSDGAAARPPTHRGAGGHAGSSLDAPGRQGGAGRVVGKAAASPFSIRLGPARLESEQSRGASVNRAAEARAWT